MIRASSLAAASLALSVAAAAQEVSVDAVDVETCFEAAGAGDTAPRCLGAASNACQAGTPGGATTPGIAACIAAETAAWDVILNREYRATRAHLSRPEGQIVDVPAALLGAQRAWIGHRDAECPLSHARWRDGTMRAVVGANCHLVLTAARAIELRDMRRGG